MSTDLVKYGTRHYACHGCYLAAGKRLSELPHFVVGTFPYFLLKRYGLLDEATRIIQAGENKP